MIDATSLLLVSAGAKTYMYHWVKSLLGTRTQDSIRLFPLLGEFSNLDHRKSSTGWLRTVMGTGMVEFSNIKGNPVLELLGASADVFHASQHLRNPPNRRTRLTATIYDMTCWIMPGVHTPSNVAATRRYGQRVLQRSTACIAISEQSKKDAIEILKLPPDRIEVIYPGVADEFFAAGCAQARVAAKKYGLEKPYFLYLGMIEPRKNIDRLIDAYRSISEPVVKEHELVIAGPLGWCSEETKARLHSPDTGVRYLGYVPEADLPGLTAGAAAFVYPSLYEGFGLPVVQAMACGVPAITSSNSSLQEIAGSDAILVDPEDTESIAAAMAQVALSPSLVEDLRRRGRARAASFRWERTAQQSLAFFHKLALM